MGIILKSQRELDKMREADLVVSAVLDAVEVACVPDVTTFELNRIAERELARARRQAFVFVCLSAAITALASCSAGPTPQ